MNMKSQLPSASTTRSSQYVASVLQVQPTKTTPTVKLDPSTGVLELSGVSIPENVSTFYAPILEWLRAYIQNPAERTTLKFSFDYFNTATSKVFMELITELESIHDGASPCVIEWHYRENDPDMLEAGEDYALITRIPFEFFKEAE